MTYEEIMRVGNDEFDKWMEQGRFGDSVRAYSGEAAEGMLIILRCAFMAGFGTGGLYANSGELASDYSEPRVHH